MVIPSPGAVCPAMVRLLAMVRFCPVMSITPPTSNTTVRLGWLTASASEPGPDALRLVTCTTVPPLPPVA